MLKARPFHQEIQQKERITRIGRENLRRVNKITNSETPVTECFRETRRCELRKLKIDYDNILKDLTLKLTSINDQNAIKNVIKTHEKKLRDLTKNMQLAFTSHETIKNFSHH